MSARTFPNYIGGQWVEGPLFENRNPADTSEIVGLHVAGIPEDIERAAAAAQAALPAWSALNGPARGALLYKVADLLEQRFDEISADMTREEGKTLAESKGEVRRSINIFRYFAAEGPRLAGVLAPSERDRVQMFAVRKPVGVVALITPWNFPSAIPAWKLAPALICGNTVVLKPASAAPLSAWRIIEACHEAGIPKGVVNFVAGPGASLGRALVEAPAVQAVSFTGSCEIGHKLHALASARRLRIQLEMGGKNPTIVLADADFASAVENVANAAFFSTGQKCTATVAGDCRGADLRSFRRRAGRADAQIESRQRHAARHRDRPVRRRGADEYGAPLHRNWPPGMRRAARRRAPVDRSGATTEDGSSSRRCSPMSIRKRPSRAKRFSGRCWR